MKRSRILSLFVVPVVLIVLVVAARWMYGLSPYAQFLKLVYNDIPVQVVPVSLTEGAPIKIRSRIIQRNTYDIYLLVYFDNSQQRIEVDELIGGPVGQPGNVAKRPGKLQTKFHIVIRDAEGKTLRDQTVSNEGKNSTGASFLGRRLETVDLDEGVYEIIVTPMTDVSRLVPFRNALMIYYVAK